MGVSPNRLANSQRLISLYARLTTQWYPEVCFLSQKLCGGNGFVYSMALCSAWRLLLSLTTPTQRWTAQRKAAIVNHQHNLILRTSFTNTIWHMIHYKQIMPKYKSIHKRRRHFFCRRLCNFVIFEMPGRHTALDNWTSSFKKRCAVRQTKVLSRDV